MKEPYVSKMRVVNIRMLKWISGHTRLDKVHNESIIENIGVVPIEYKLREETLR